MPGAARRSVALLFLAALTLPLAMAGEWDNEGKELEQDCSGPFLLLVKSCAAFLFNGGSPVRLSIPTSVVPGGGTALGAMYVQPLDIHDWAGSNLTIEGGSSVRSFWYGNAVASFNHRKWGGDWNTARDIFQVQIYSHGRGLPQMPFYGIGPDTARSDLTDFRERDFTAGVSVINPLQSWLSVRSRSRRAVDRRVLHGSDRAGFEPPAGLRALQRFFAAEGRVVEDADLFTNCL
jgi:hypothetical protein